MSIESPKNVIPEESDKRVEAWKKIAKIREKDNYHEDSLKKLAYYENEEREKERKEFLEKHPQFNPDEKNISDKEKNERQEIVASHLYRIGNKLSDVKLDNIKLEKNQIFDALSGLRSRAALDAEIPQILSREKRKKGKCCLLMIDIDRFKRINDSYGHPLGDKVIKNVSDLFRKSLRENDLAYRYGGDEFTIFLPDMDIDDVEKIITRIRENLAKYNTGKKFNINEDVTLSIGISSADYSKNDKNKDILIKEADLALYHVKATGRNGSLECKPEMKEKEKK